MNKSFETVFIRENLNDIPAATIQSGHNEMLNMISVTEGDVARCIEKLKSKQDACAR